MVRKGVLFARVSVDYADHPKIGGLSDAAFRAHISMILYARKYETDGVIKNRVANQLANPLGSGSASEVLNELQNNDEDAPSLVRMINGDYLLHGFTDLQETKQEIDARRSRNAENGAKGGRPPKTESVSKSVSGSGANSGAQKKAESESESESESEVLKDLSDASGAARKTPPGYPSDFEEFWSAYPLKEGKKPALRRWQEQKKKVGAERLLTQAKAYAHYIEVTGRYCKQAQGWLNEARYEDDYRTLIAQQTAAQARPQPSRPSKSRGWLEAAYSPNTNGGQRAIGQ